MRSQLCISKIGRDNYYYEGYTRELGREDVPGGISNLMDLLCFRTQSTICSPLAKL